MTSNGAALAFYQPKSWLRRWLLGLSLAFAALWVTVPSQAYAEAGRPAGWAAQRATNELRVGRVQLRYEPHLEDEAQWLAESIPGWWSGIERALAGDVDDTLTITFVEHAGRVAEATGMPHWVAGVASPSRGEIMIARHGPDGARTDLDNLLRHEMAHVALFRATGGAALPRWFHEGVAESFEGGISLTRAQTLATAVFGPGVPDLERLEAQFHGTDKTDAAVAYAAARDLVTFMRDHDATGASFRQVLGQLRLGHSFEASFVRAYGLSLPELVGQWRATLPGRFVWYPMVAGGGLPLAMVFPLVVVAWVRRRRLIRRGFERLEREDALAAMAYREVLSMAPGSKVGLVS